VSLTALAHPQTERVGRDPGGVYPMVGGAWRLDSLRVSGWRQRLAEDGSATGPDQSSEARAPPARDASGTVSKRAFAAQTLGSEAAPLQVRFSKPS